MSKEQIPDGYKKCRCCGEILPYDSFCNNKRKKDGKNIYCRECMSKIRSTSEYKHKDAEYHRQAYNSKHPNVQQSDASSIPVRIEYIDKYNNEEIYANKRVHKNDIICKCEKCGILFYAPIQDIQQYCSLSPDDPTRHLLCPEHKEQFIEFLISRGYQITDLSVNNSDY